MYVCDNHVLMIPVCEFEARTQADTCLHITRDFRSVSQDQLGWTLQVFLEVVVKTKVTNPGRHMDSKIPLIIGSNKSSLP